MKTNLFSILLCTSIIFSSTAQNESRYGDIEKQIIAFSLATEKQDVVSLKSLLDDEFRVVMNQLFESEQIVVLNKNAYLEKIESKAFGGKKRGVIIESITVHGKTASAKVIFKGTDLSFVSLFTFIQDKQRNWKLISDVPQVH